MRVIGCAEATLQAYTWWLRRLTAEADEVTGARGPNGQQMP